jgi:hypothetical protein
MATVSHPIEAGSVARPQAGEYPAVTRSFDLWSAVLAMWVLAGMFIDGWAHNHGYVDESFFTPWHGLLYTGVLAMGAFLAFHQYRNAMKGYAWTRALPKPYMLSLLGVVIFMAGGGFDFVWHSLFGFEANSEALLSPAHLILATGAFLFLSGPARSAWARPQSQLPVRWGTMYPAILSLLAVLSLFTFFVQYATLFTDIDVLSASFAPVNPEYPWNVTGLAAAILPAVILSAFLMLTIRRWTLPFGAYTLIFTLNALLMFFERLQFGVTYWPVLLAAVIAGLAADVLLRTLRPSAERVGALRLYGFAIPFLLVAAYFAILIAIAGIWWSIHMWLGVSFVAGIIGLFMSYVAVPPAIPAE